MKTRLMGCVLMLLMIGVTYSYASENLAQSAETNGTPVVHYPFDGNANDYSGSALHLTISGNPQPCTDRHGITNGAYQLDGIQDYFWVADNPILRPEYFTICAWFCSESKTGYTRILEKRYKKYAPPYSSYLLEMDIDSSLPQAHLTLNGERHIIPAQQSAAYDSWHHLCASYDGSTFKLYLDGELSSSMDLTGAISYLDLPLCIGNAHQGASEEQLFKGKLDDVRIYNYALSESAIRNMYDMVTMPRNFSIDCTSGQPLLSWDAQAAECSFSVYSASNSLAVFPDEWVLEESEITDTQWQDVNPQARSKFYRVGAIGDE